MIGNLNLSIPVQIILQKNSLFQKRLKKAVEKDLATKKLSKQADSPNFLIAFSVAVEDKVDVRSDRFG